MSSIPEGHNSADTGAPLPPIAPSEFLVCRRCGKNVAANLAVCPYCDAQLPVVAGMISTITRGQSIRRQAEKESESHRAISRMIAFYVAMLASSILGALIVHADNAKRLSGDDKMILVLFLELIDTVIVLTAWFMIPRPPKVAPTNTGMRVAGWLAAPLILAFVLGLNFGYHHLIESYVQYPKWARNEPEASIWLVIVAVCVQPAIIEELFFRCLALGTLARVMSIPAAILVSSLMFGMAHSFVLLSIPILTVVGMGLGLVRVWSGSIVLPMLLHAVHNAVVLRFEQLT